MIAFIRGRLLDKQPNRLVVDVHGVGYELLVPLSTYYDIGDVGAETALYVHTHVREEALQLYGFRTSVEQHLFERLISISGIGPKLGIAVLSGIEPHDLVRAVQQPDVGRLTRVPGIGRKTAERIVLELKDRLGQIVPGEPGEPEPPETEVNRVREDLVSVLHNLGYHRPLAERAADAVLESHAGASLEQALRAALRELMRK
jgi:Holliday junction DNA helicase RuvA